MGLELGSAEKEETRKKALDLGFLKKTRQTMRRQKRYLEHWKQLQTLL